MSLSQDDIQNWKDDGWKFRVKTVKGKKYITRRRGKQEKGLGRFDEILWKMINRGSILSKKDLERIEYEKQIESLMYVYRGFEMSLDCVHITDGYCFFWKYDEQPGFFRLADSISAGTYYRKVDHDAKLFWVFIALPFYCRGCTAYTRA
jgi:ribosomal protein L34